LSNYAKYSIMTGLVTFVIALILFLTIDSSHPYISGLLVAFIIFEINFYHLFGKEVRGNKSLKQNNQI